MIRPNPKSLRIQVVLVIFLTSAIALALASAAFVAYEYSSVRSRMATRLAALAGIVGENCRSALVFGDRRDAERTLSGLRADSRMLAAAVYDREGRLFAGFAVRPQERFPETLPAASATISGQRIAVTRAIEEDGRSVGTVWLAADVASFEDQFREFARAGGGVLLLALVVAALLAYRLQRIVADPVLRLVAAARTVAASQDLGVRVAPASPDELGLLTDTFNGMLAKLESRDRELRESEARYALAVRGAQDGLWDWDLSSGEIYFAPRFKELLGHSGEEIGSRPAEWFDRIHPQDRNLVHAALDAHLTGATPHFEAEYRMQHRNGGWLWVSTRGEATRDALGRPQRLAGSLADITARKGTDPLTGLPNRLLFLDRVETGLRREKGSDRTRFAVLALELERFDLIQETLGRRAGGELLIAAVERIARVLGPRDSLAALESGRFAVLRELEEAADAAQLADEIHRAVAPAVRIDEQDHFSSVAIGIAFGHPGYETAEEVVRDALAALGLARDGGWNRTEVFDETLRARAFARLELEDALRRAVDRGELFFHYQPIFTLAGQRLAGLEALLRWERRPEGLVPTEQFIALAEECGIIVPLGRWALGEACRQLAAWRAAEPSAAELVLSVNVSPLQLARLEFVGEVAAALAASGVPAGALKLEITESVLVEQREPVRTVLHELDRLGVGLWIDDFGTGYSNLSYLHRFPIEAMKIDRSFVNRLDSEGERREIVGTLVALAHNLEMKAIAEGVETQRQLERLAGYRCEYVQGHILSHPLPAAEVETLLARNGGESTGTPGAGAAHRQNA